jgi:hypothetical protein
MREEVESKDHNSSTSYDPLPNPKRIEVVANSVVCYFDDEQFAIRTAKALTDIFENIEGDVEDLVKELKDRKSKKPITLSKFSNPITPIVEELNPNKNDKDMYVFYHGFRFTAKCPNCDWCEYFSSSIVAYTAFDSHVERYHSNDKTLSRGYKYRFNRMKKNWR